MKKKSLLLLVLLLAFSEVCHGQGKNTRNIKVNNKDKSKSRTNPEVPQSEIRSERRKWRSMRRKLKPQQLKEMTEELAKLKKENSTLMATNESLKETSTNSSSKIQSELNRLKNIEAEYEAYKNKVKSYDKSFTDFDIADINILKGANTEDVIFKVQVGAYRNYKNASALKDKLRKHGYKTWIIAMRGDARIPISNILHKIIRHTSKK